MKPLSKEITDEIRFILEGCRDGRLEHDQSDAFCGSARCIAGWKITLDLQKRPEFTGKEITERVAYGFLHEVNSDGGVCAYAESKWKLTESESLALFDANATLEDQFDLLEKLEKGERIV